MSKEIRSNILNEVNRILLGPIDGDDEQLVNSPLDFYTVGVLFPKVLATDETGDDAPENTVVSSENENFSDLGDDAANSNIDDGNSYNYTKSAPTEASLSDEDALELTTKFRPSAAGISVLVPKGARLKITASFGTYEILSVDRPAKNQSDKITRVSVFKRYPFTKQLEYRDKFLNTEGFTHVRAGNRESIILHRHCSLDIVTRPYKLNSDLEIKTFTLINENVAVNFKHQRKAENCIYQPQISVENKLGFHSFDDFSDVASMSSEDRNLKLLYRNYKSYALGHGISVDWSGVDSHITQVSSQVLPVEIVKGIDMNPSVYKNTSALFMKKLGGQDLEQGYDWKLVKVQLEGFVMEYHNWIADTTRHFEMAGRSLHSELKASGDENLNKCRILYRRMLDGIEILDQNIIARKAFEDANAAMFMQRVMADFSKHRRQENRIISDSDTNDDYLPEYASIPYDSTSGRIWKDGKFLSGTTERNGSLAKWRPFQLAFLLFQIRGIIDPTSDDRETVDLIWFATGGGKTEAYLGLTAFTIFYRRLFAKHTSGNPNEGAGVSVLMRYTLRLLNKQQFERAAILICACDLIRRKDPDSYGHKRISNGIWMGSSMTPNKEENQINDYKNFIDRVDKGWEPDSFRNSPPLLSCPCCGNRLVKENKVGRWGYFRARNIKNRVDGPYLIGCTNTRCCYHVNDKNYQNKRDHTLPIYEVDEIIYKERPSLVFSTVDKFVQMAWNSSTFSLFNIDFSSEKITRIYQAPTLIIQDELHLISSALGTIYGVYEIVIDKLCKEIGGFSPKIVGASATVRNAAEQCRRLYAKKHFLQFPPPGIDADDSFFSKKIHGEDPKDRLYIGFMTSGTTTSTALIRLASVLLERIPALAINNKELDNYYTLVVYFNALKELGKFRTFVADDIVAYRKLLANHFGTFIKLFNYSALCELSSVMTAEDITRGLDRLEKVTLPAESSEFSHLIRKLFSYGIRTSEMLTYAKGPLWRELINKEFFDIIGLPFKDNADDYKALIALVKQALPQKAEPIQIAPATNMISVGVDVPRLNTMIINGQPKTASEYIQASSRVGREMPGIVFSFLSPTKNRDRSHYERFKSFHQSYYYHVESSSVTPYSGPALEKVIPTVLIALIRSLFLNGKAVKLEINDPLLHKFIDSVLNEICCRSEIANASSDLVEIKNTMTRIRDAFFQKMAIIGNGRQLAVNHDYLRFENGKLFPRFDRQISVYNAPSQFVDTILKDHIPTMQTLRNVESSSQVAIKNTI
jgi:hypothetical protein